MGSYFVVVNVLCRIMLSEYGSTGYRVSSLGIQNKKAFCLKINTPKGNYCIFRIDVVASCQKFGIILVTKCFQKMMLPKNDNNKKFAPKFVFFNEKFKK